MTTNERREMLKKEISLGEMIATAVILLGVCIGFYVSTNVELSNHEIRIKLLEETKKEQKEEIKAEFDELKKLIDEVIKGQNAIQIKMENKQDKKQ